MKYLKISYIISVIVISLSTILVYVHYGPSYIYGWEIFSAYFLGWLGLIGFLVSIIYLHIKKLIYALVFGAIGIILVILSWIINIPLIQYYTTISFVMVGSGFYVFLISLILIIIINAWLIKYRGFKGIKEEKREMSIREAKLKKESIPTVPRVSEDSWKKEDILVFISYATKDAELFRIKEIAKLLTSYKEIKEVLYWQKSMTDNIFKYMNDNLGRCDVMLLFCSPNALGSQPVEKEWTAADSMGKPIIPIFFKPDHIPHLLKSRLGFEFDNFNFEKNIKALHKLILKKCSGNLTHY